MSVYNPVIPQATDLISSSQPLILGNFSQLNLQFAVDHVAFYTGSANGTGFHKKVTFSSNNVPSIPTTPPVLFTNDVTALPQLFFYSGTAAQSSSQYVSAVNGSTMALGGIVIKWGTFIGTTGSNVAFASPFPNACLSITLTASTSARSPFATTFDKTSFNIGFSGGGSPTVYYIAIGN